MKLLRYVIFAFLATLCLSGMANITSQTNRVGPYTISALPAALSVTFPFQASSELLVLNLGASGTENDPATVLTLNSDYTVSGGGYNSTTNMQSGTVTVVSGGANAVEVGDYIVILRNVPVNQATSLTSGILTAAAVEKALDKQATLSQQLTEAVSRSLRFEKGEVLDGTLDRTARMGKYLGFDSTGALTYLDGSGGGGGGTTYTAGAGLQLASNVFSVLPTQSFTDLTVTNPISGSVTGNAATATALQTARTINGTSFNGTANITVAAAAGTLTGTTLAANVVNSSLTTAAVGTLAGMAIQNPAAVNITGGDIDGANVTGLPAPTNSSDAATKDYVDNISAGITPRTGVVAATTANITLSGPQTIDGVGVIAGNRVLVKNQTLPEENGIYDCAAGAWSRSSDSNTAGELLFGYYYFVSSGTTNGATSWFIETAPTVLGTDPVVFSQFSASQNYTAGTGLSLAGSQFSINSSVVTLTGAQALSNKAITSSTIDGTVIGGTTPAAITGTSVTANLGNVLIRSGYSLNLNNAANNTTASIYNQASSGNENITLYIGGLDRATFTASGFSVTGTLQSDGNATIGTGSAASTRTLTINGGSTPNTGSYIDFKQAGTSTSRVGVDGPITGSSTNDLGLWANTGNSISFYVNGSFTRLARMTTAGLNVAGSYSVSTDANIRTTKDNFNVTVNVKDYGATGDGVTNDTAAIAAAVAALPASNATLVIPAGIYITDEISISGKTGLSVLGDGYGITTLKGRTGNRVLVIASSTGVTVRGLTFDGNCSARTAGQQAVTIDASGVLFTENKVINSGEYAAFFGSGAQIQDVQVIGNYIGSNFADGINFQNVIHGVIANNVVDGVDDDGIAVGWNGSGIASDIVVSGNYVRARNDLATTWGRGIAILGCTDVLVANNIVEDIKQTGILVAQETSATRATRITVTGNQVKGVAIHSGHGIAVYESTDCSLLNNVVEDPEQGSLIEIADWQNLVIEGGAIRQNNDVFGRGIHVDESSGWAASWDRLRISGVAIDMLGASTNNCIYLSPHSSSTMNTVIINGVTGYQVVAGNYIQVNGTQTGTLAKIVNNVDVTGSRTISPSSGGIFTVTNNN